LILAVLAILAGIVGFVLALLPGTRGGIVSFFAAAAGFIGVIVAMVKLFSGPHP
jgi:hypothetical protein